MNRILAMSLIAASLFLGCAHQNERTSASSPDVGSVGPDGAVYLAALGSKPNRIKLMACPTNKILSTDPTTAQSQCTSEPDYNYEILDTTFKIILDQYIKLAFFKSSQGEAYNAQLNRFIHHQGYPYSRVWLSDQGYQYFGDWITELDQIRKFDAAYPGGNANLKRKAQLEKLLTPENMIAYNFIKRETELQLLKVAEFLNKIKAHQVSLVMSSQNDGVAGFLPSMYNYCKSRAGFALNEDKMASEHYCVYTTK